MIKNPKTLKPRGAIPVETLGHYGDIARPGCKFVYAVVGMGQFPDDMLRYDDGAAESDPSLGRARRSILVRANRCTPARWGSFGWRLDGHSILEVEDVR